jgi:hypothetical protein
MQVVEELLEWIESFPDHLEVKVNGTPALNVLYGEVGLKVPEIVGVGGRSQQSDWRLERLAFWY